MCHPSVLMHVPQMLSPQDLIGQVVLEVGSYDVNGSVRPLLEPYVASWIGVDATPGPRVDEVVNCDHLIERFGGDSFGVVVSTEMLEHVRDWQGCLFNLLTVVASGGLLLVTTRSEGFPYHPFPEDNWRSSVAGFRDLLESAEFEVLQIMPDPDPFSPGLFCKARKPVGWEWPPGKTPAELWVGADVTSVQL